MIYEVVSIASLTASAFLAGACISLVHSNSKLQESIIQNNAALVEELDKEFDSALDKLEEKVSEFDDITRKASDANNSLAGKIKEIDERTLQSVERLNMLQMGATQTWKK